MIEVGKDPSSPGVQPQYKAAARPELLWFTTSEGLNEVPADCGGCRPHRGTSPSRPAPITLSLVWVRARVGKTVTLEESAASKLYWFWVATFWQQGGPSCSTASPAPSHSRGGCPCRTLQVDFKALYNQRHSQQHLIEPHTCSVATPHLPACTSYCIATSKVLQGTPKHGCNHKPAMAEMTIYQCCWSTLNKAKSFPTQLSLHCLSSYTPIKQLRRNIDILVGLLTAEFVIISPHSIKVLGRCMRTSYPSLWWVTPGLAHVGRCLIDIRVRKPQVAEHAALPAFPLCPFSSAGLTCGDPGLDSWASRNCRVLLPLELGLNSKRELSEDIAQAAPHGFGTRFKRFKCSRRRKYWLLNGFNKTHSHIHKRLSI